jgi:arsenate reductase-like glutaredoxin family protein
LRKQTGLELDEVNMAKADALDEAMVKSIVEKAGGVAAVLNTRHATAKENGWAESPPDAATFAKAAVKEVNLLKRPIVIAGKTVIVGFNKTEYAKLAR